MEYNNKLTLGDREYLVTPFPALKAHRLLNKLTRLFGPALSTILGGIMKDAGKKNIADIEINSQDVSDGIGSLFDKLDEDTWETITRELLTGVTAIIPSKDGKKAQYSFSESSFSESFNLVFNRRLMEVYPVIIHVLKYNYPDFFGRMAGIGDLVKIRMSAVGGINETDE